MAWAEDSFWCLGTRRWEGRCSERPAGQVFLFRMIFRMLCRQATLVLSDRQLSRTIRPCLHNFERVKHDVVLILFLKRLAWNNLLYFIVQQNKQSCWAYPISMKRILRTCELECFRRMWLGTLGFVGWEWMHHHRRNRQGTYRSNPHVAKSLCLIPSYF